MYTYKYEDTDKTDELLAGEEQMTTVINVEVNSGTALTRGTVLAGEDGQKYAPIAANDAGRSIVIVANDCESTATVVSAYASGKFHREKLISAVDLTEFETEMRRQNLFMTSLK